MDNLKIQVIEKVKALMVLAKQSFPRHSFPEPSIHFDVTGTRGGFQLGYEVHYNYVLLLENTQHFLENVVPHEVAHYIQRIIAPETLAPVFGNRRKSHGEWWKTIMRLLGADPKCYHNYDTSNVSSTRNFKRQRLYCSCNFQHLVTLRLINKIKNGRKYRCTKCKGLVSLNPIPNQIPLAA